MIVNIIIEETPDGGFSCYTQEEFPDFALFGYGDTIQSSMDDMLCAYQELKEMLANEGKDVPKLEFVYHYDSK
jgi:predicted RNase H-like HicB family nuclease